jgi:tetratricopeptide (TPR) repeat protein
MKLKFVFLLSVLLLNCIFLSAQKKNKKKMLSINESQYVFLFDEANKNRLLENYDLAADQYLDAIQLNTESAVSYFYLASIYLLKKEYTTALTYANKAVEIQPNNFWYKVELADINYVIGNDKEAVKLYENLYNQYPNNNFAYERLMSRLNEMKDLDKMIKYYELRETNKVLDEKEYLDLFELYKKMNEFSKAESILKKLIVNNPENPKYGQRFIKIINGKIPGKLQRDSILCPVL